MCWALQAAEAAEDAELLILATDPALRQTPDPSESSTAGALNSVLGFQLPDHSSSTDTAAATESAATALNNIPGFALSSHTATAAAEPSADLAALAAVATASAQAPDAQASENEAGPVSVDASGDPSAKEEVGSTSQAEGLLTLHSSSSAAARDVNSTTTADAAIEPTSAGVGTDADGSARTADDVQGADVGTSAGTKPRGKWGIPQQPFTAAGRGTEAAETAGSLLGSAATAVVPGGSAVSTLTTAASEESAAAKELPELAQAESATADETAPTAVPDVAAESKSPPTATATSTGTAATAGSEIVSPIASQQELATAQSAAATAGAGSGTSDRPAAGQYRRVAWAPVHNPFPAAGQKLAAPQQPLTQAHATDSDTHAGARLTQEAEVTQTHSHAAAAEGATEQNTTAEHDTTAEQDTTAVLEAALVEDQSGTIVAHGSLGESTCTIWQTYAAVIVSKPNHAPFAKTCSASCLALLHFAFPLLCSAMHAVLCCMVCCITCCMLCMQSHFYILCHLWSRARLSCTAKSAAASHLIHAISDMHDAEGVQDTGEGRKKRAGWKGVVQPFTAAGSSNPESATASTHPAASRYSHPLIRFSGLDAARSVVILCLRSH